LRSILIDLKIKGQAEIAEILKQFHVMATNCLLRLRFRGIFVCCLSVATSFGVTAEPGRIVMPARTLAYKNSAAEMDYSIFRRATPSHCRY
jgi:hypothetical protein